MQGRTNREVATEADITENTLGRLIRGQAWGALPILIRLEEALDADLRCGKAHQGEGQPCCRCPNHCVLLRGGRAPLAGLNQG